MVPPTDNPGLVTAGRNRGWCFHCGWTTDLFADPREAAEAVNAHVLVCEKHPLRIKLNAVVTSLEWLIRVCDANGFCRAAGRNGGDEPRLAEARIALKQAKGE